MSDDQRQNQQDHQDRHADLRLAVVEASPIVSTFDEDNGVLFVTWPEVNRACQDRLGHDHDGDPESDRAVCEAFEAAGALAWVHEAEGGRDRHGWWLLTPRGRAASRQKEGD